MMMVLLLLVGWLDGCSSVFIQIVSFNCSRETQRKFFLNDVGLNQYSSFSLSLGVHTLVGPILKFNAKFYDITLNILFSFIRPRCSRCCCRTISLLIIMIVFVSWLPLLLLFASRCVVRACVCVRAIQPSFQCKWHVWNEGAVYLHPRPLLTLAQQHVSTNRKDNSYNNNKIYQAKPNRTKPK